jgi:hypothetical protein
MGISMGMTSYSRKSQIHAILTPSQIHAKFMPSASQIHAKLTPTHTDVSEGPMHAYQVSVRPLPLLLYVGTTHTHSSARNLAIVTNFMHKLYMFYAIPDHTAPYHTLHYPFYFI